jgi:VIT1/CCC1 family predicted Fe2+/Mn2+ transporter
MDDVPSGINFGSILRDAILGGQDGLVNVLGIVLALASATSDAHVVIVGALAALVAESVSMGAVAYTSQKASEDYYLKERQRKRRFIEESPESQKKILTGIYKSKGITGTHLKRMVDAISSSKEAWLNILLTEELDLAPKDSVNPVSSALLVGFSAVVGSIIPLLPFLVLPVTTAMVASVLLSIIVLFAAGAYKTRYTVGNWFSSGLELAVIGTLAGLLGFIVGKLLAAAPI